MSRFKRDEYTSETTKEILKSSIHNSVLEEFFKSKSDFNRPYTRVLRINGSVIFIYGQKLNIYTNHTSILVEDSSGVNIDGKYYKEYNSDGIVIKPASSKEDLLNSNNIQIQHYNPLFLFEKEGKFIYYDLYGINGLYSDQYYEYKYDMYKDEVPGLTLEEMKNILTKSPFDLTEGELFGNKLSQEEKLELLKNLEDHYDQNAEKKYSYIIEKNKTDKIEKDPQTNVGLNAGVGVDFVIIDRFMLGIEYKYSEVKFSNYNLKAQTHNIGVRLGVQFL